MKAWIEIAKQALTKSLKPVPQELNQLDWKLDLTSKETKLSHHISAFANTEGGGFFVLGVDKDGVVRGIDEKTFGTIITRLGNIGRDGVEPPVMIDHSIEEYDGKPLLFIFIPESKSRPVRVRGKSIEDSYIRSGAQTRKMDQREIRKVLISSQPTRYEELTAYTSSSLTEILQRLDYVRVFDMLKLPVPKNDVAIAEFLFSQKLLSRSNEFYNITNLGAAICAKELQAFTGKERNAVRVIKYVGSSREKTEREMEGRRGYAVGFEGLIHYIKSLLPESEIIKDALRQTVSIYPEIAIREIVANALIHQDFLASGMGPMVELFSDRMEITNPGRLLPTIRIERLIDSAPESRNELLAAFMRRLNICEERGSGIDKALRSIEVYGMPPPEFIEGENYFRATLFSPRPFAKMTKEERVRACYFHCCLKHVSNDKMTNTTLRDRFKIEEKNYPMVSKIITDTIEAGLIKPGDPENKSKKYAFYVPFWFDSTRPDTR